MPLASALFAGGNVAMAADAAPDAAAPEGGALEEVTVTAQKRAEDLQKVPISLTVLGGEKLEQLQVTNFDDYAKFLPSVSYQSLGPGQSQLYFRGIASGQDGLHAGSLPTTGVYLDEIPVTTIGNTLDVHVYDIARVEALAGPQGTLYGASSLSGTLRIITNKPDPSKFSASYDIKGDKYKHGDGGGEFEGYVNIPIADNAAVRLVGYYDHVGGYIDNVLVENTYQRGVPAAGIPNDPLTVSNAPYAKNAFNDSDSFGGRGTLLVNLNENWTITPQVIYQNTRSNGNYSFDPALGDLKVGDFNYERNVDHWYQSALTIEGKVSDFDILYSGGWFERKVDNLVDYSGYTVAYDALSQTANATISYTRYQTPSGTLTDPTQFNANYDKYTKMSHELRVTTPADYRLRGTAGLFYQRQTDNIRAEFGAHNLPEYYDVTGQTDTVYLTQQSRADRDYAVFTDMTFDVTPALKVSGGIRKFWVENTLFGFFGFNAGQSGEGSCYGPPVTGLDLPCINTDKKVVENGETHRLNATYQIDPDRMVYFTYSTGFRPGGNNRRVGVASYAQDTLTNLEGGWKTSWLDRRLRFNGAIFYERWKGVQLAVTGANGITSIINVGDAAVKGAEGELQWLPIDNLTLSASGTYVNAKTLQEFCDVDQTTELVTHDCQNPNAPKGTRLPVTPLLKANGTARYQFTTNSYNNFVQASLIHQSSARSELQSDEAAAMGDLPAFTTADFSLGTAKDNWTVEAYIENAFDERGILGKINQCANLYCYAHYRAYPIKPMNFGIKFGQKF
jgi:iron complex outermembrane recepter protein